MAVTDRVRAVRKDLTPAERRVAQVVLRSPEAVAFGTVATLAQRARTSGPTVLRMAAKAGFDGFVELQAAVQQELAQRLRPAAERILERPPTDQLRRALEVELENVRATLGGVDPATFDRAVRHLTDRSHDVLVLSGEATFGIGLMLAEALGALRDGVELLTGSQVRVTRRLATAQPGDMIVAIDVRRYERWVLTSMRLGAERRARIIAVTDGLLSPLADAASEVFVVDALGAGPFDSHVGTLALVNALVAASASRLRRTAASRLRRVEAAWAGAETLVDS